MSTKNISYKSGYKYTLTQKVIINTDIKPKKDINTPYISLSRNGILIIHAGYSWDGATFAIDTKDFMRGSLAHDALYQLMGDGLLPFSYRKQADKLLVKLCKEDGMSSFRAAYVYRMVRWFGKSVLELRS